MIPPLPQNAKAKALDLLAQHWIRVATETTGDPEVNGTYDALSDALVVEHDVKHPLNQGDYGRGFNDGLFAGLEIAAIIHENPTAPSLSSILVMVERVRREIDWFAADAARRPKPAA